MKKAILTLFLLLLAVACDELATESHPATGFYTLDMITNTDTCSPQRYAESGLETELIRAQPSGVRVPFHTKYQVARGDFELKEVRSLSLPLGPPVDQCSGTATYWIESMTGDSLDFHYEEVWETTEACSTLENDPLASSYPQSPCKLDQTWHFQMRTACPEPCLMRVTWDPNSGNRIETCECE